MYAGCRGEEVKIIIIGENRAEFISVKNADIDRHFVQSRGQLYKLYPHALSRMRIVKDGLQKESEEVIVFAENHLEPYHDRGVPFDQDVILAEIDEHKHTLPRSAFGKFKAFIGTSGRVGRSIWPYLGVIIGGIVVVWAIVSSGGIKF